MPGRVKVVARLKRLNNLVEDEVQNTFYFANDSSDVISAAGATEIATRLNTFYNVAGTGSTEPIAEYLGENLSRVINANRYDFYNSVGLGVPETWGSPVQTRQWQLTNATNAVVIPGESAVCLSYHADLTDVPETAPDPENPGGTIRPAARLRGRLYIGPLSTLAVSNDITTLEPVPNSNFVNALKGAALDLIAANTLNYIWVGQSKADGFFWEVDGGFIDNAFDSQRRRGNAPTMRTTF